MIILLSTIGMIDKVHVEIETWQDFIGLSHALTPAT
jgi:hypothetical protein